MASVALNLRSLSVSEKVALARRVFAAMTDNAFFPAPDPPLVLLARLTNELDGTRDSQSLVKNESLLGETLGRLATYVEKVSGGSEPLIAASGMPVDAPDGGDGAIQKPANFTATFAKHPGEISLRCDPVPGAKTYVFQSTPDPISPASDWLIGSVSTGPIGTITSLTPGQCYGFRVSAVGPSGQGPWSDSISKEVP